MSSDNLTLKKQKLETSESTPDQKQHHPREIEDNDERIIKRHEWVEPIDLDIQKTFLYYYADATRNRQPFDYKFICSLPESYGAFMDQHKLWRTAFPKWLMETEKKILTEWTAEEKHSICEILSDEGCVAFHLWFSHGCPQAEDWKEEMDRFKITKLRIDRFCCIKNVLFDRAKLYPGIPENSILFRGIRSNEWGHKIYPQEHFKGEKENFSEAAVGDEMLVTRPLSTSWSIHCALHWAIDQLLIFQVKNPNSTPAVNVQPLGDRGSSNGRWAECEVLLVPPFKCKISDLKRNQVFEVYSQLRPLNFSKHRTIDLIFIDVVS